MKSGIFTKLKSVGPAAFVAAAFIGPGTVTTCSLAGSSFGYALLWSLLFSIIATLILQEMSARLGLIGQLGLGEAIRKEFRSPFGRLISSILVISAIAIGNAAYETGNIMGGAMGLEVITGISKIDIGPIRINLWGPLIGIIAFLLLYRGNYKLIEKGLIGLVILMSLTFIITVLLVKPEPGQIARGLFKPSIPDRSILTIVGLIGTTVVPYNLFLHASAVREKWKTPEMLNTVRTDSIISIGLGGVISMAIIITSAAAFYGTSTIIRNAGDMAVQLQPLLGKASGMFLAFGLLSAGISSAITAPLAAAYATTGILGWEKDLKHPRFRSIWIIVLLTGIIFSSIGFNPVNAIFFAQITNGILLPLIAIFLLKIMNSSKLLGEYRNKLIANLAGFFVVLVSILLGVRSILTVTGII